MTTQTARLAAFQSNCVLAGDAAGELPEAIRRPLQHRARCPSAGRATLCTELGADMRYVERVRGDLQLRHAKSPQFAAALAANDGAAAGKTDAVALIEPAGATEAAADALSASAPLPETIRPPRSRPHDAVRSVRRIQRYHVCRCHDPGPWQAALARSRKRRPPTHPFHRSSDNRNVSPAAFSTSLMMM